MSRTACVLWFACALASAVAACQQNPPPAGLTAAQAAQQYADLPVRAAADTSGFPEPVDLALALTLADPATGVPGVAAAAVRAEGPWSGKLVLLLTEVGRPPAQYREILREWARLGHHALALPLPLAQGLTETCGKNHNCYEDSRWELYNGSDHTPSIAVKYADSVESRYVATVLEFAKKGQGWGQFVQGGKPLWSSTVVAGHGEGAGQAAFVASHVTAARVALLAGPTDGMAESPASWLTGMHQTPTSQWFAFGHTADPLWPRIANAWTALGLGAGAASWPSVDAGAVGGVQGYTTAYASKEPHAAVAVDDLLPRDGAGKPLYRLIWRTLAGN